MRAPPEIMRLAIRIANLAADTTEANEIGRRSAAALNLPPVAYAQLLLEVAALRSRISASGRPLFGHSGKGERSRRAVDWMQEYPVY